MGKLKEFLHSAAAKTAAVLLAAALLFTAIVLTFKEKPQEGTELEQRLVGILSEVEGVRGAKAMIAEEDGRAVSAVVLFEGADSILTRSRVLDITASVLQLDKRHVQVYPARS